MWTPAVKGRTGPRYLAIAEALAEDIDEGKIAAGAQLPTHRDLAEKLGVTVGTVTRAYAEAARRGLVSGEVGRGTFVRGGEEGAVRLSEAEGPDASLIDLSLNYPVRDPQVRLVASGLSALAARPEAEGLLQYHTHAGHPAHRAAGARWIARSVPGADPERIVITCGAQHAMSVAFAALTKPGDTVLTEELTYPGMKSVASLLHLRLRGVAMDAEGIIPEMLDAACRSGSARALYCMPTIHNPTGALMPERRRRRLLEVAAKHNLMIVEDEIYSFLAGEAPPALAALAPDRVLHITSVSKSIAPGLRIGYLLMPPGMVGRAEAGMRATCWMASPLMAELAATWIGDGTAERLVQFRRYESGERQRMARQILKGRTFRAHPTAYHIWLQLPDGLEGAEFASRARQRGVAITPPETFHVGRDPVPRAVRVCLGAAGSRARLATALRILAEVLGGASDTGLSVM